MEKHPWHILILLAALSLLTACGPASRPTPGQPGQKGTVLPDEADRPGWLKQARYWQARAAETAEPPARTQALLHAADAYARAGEARQAETLLAALPTDIGPTLRLKADLVRARLALQRQSASEALVWLTLRDSQVPAELKTEFHRLQGDVFSQLQVWLDAALAYQKAASWLADDQQAQPLYRSIHQALSRVDSHRLRQALETDETVRRYPEFQGWIAFTLAVRDSLNQPDRLQENLAQWRRLYPLHPAGNAFLEETTASLPVELHPPKQLALLLPLDGPYRPPARAVQHGVLAHLFESHTGVDLRVYPVDAGPEHIVERYRAAVDDGADWVAGPLLKAQVTQLLDQELPVPVLALNTPEDARVSATRPGLFHFALSPEDEATQMARLMWQRGVERALLILPQDDRGQRVERAFRQAYEQLGGLTVATGRYNPARSDHSAMLKGLLQLQASRQRKRSLQRLLGRPLEFEPRARDDVDGIFLFANATQARQLRPQLKFHRAGHLPVFATSAVYQGRPNPEQDRDLDGVTFCDMPWLHNMGDREPRRETLARQLPKAGGSLGRFHALGLDILPLLSYLPWMQEHPEFRLPAATGQLRLEGQHIRRDLTCFRFRKGLPEWIGQAAPAGARIP